MKILFVILIFLPYSFVFGQHSVIYDFSGPENFTGNQPMNGLISDGTYLYGVTMSGGILQYGNIFRIMPDGSNYENLFEFNGTNGSNPSSELIYDGTFIYGTTQDGGTFNAGTIYKLLPDGSGFTTLLNFNNPSIGANPSGKLFLNGGIIYGSTQSGGVNFSGTIYKIATDGSNFSLLHEFDGGANGGVPVGGLVSNGTELFGMTYMYGDFGVGTAFKINLDGTGFLKLHDFNGGSEGSYPFGTVVIDGTYLYGMTAQNGAFNGGTVFKMETDGSNFTVLKNFDSALDGSFPYGSLILDSGNLFGTTMQGGSFNQGVVFKIGTDGSNYNVLHHFNFVPDGASPRAQLFVDGSMLYGTTLSGGLTNNGTLFKIQTDGTNYQKIYDFNMNTLGASPAHGLISDGEFLYGMTSYGGVYNKGTIFKIKSDGSGFEILMSFDGSNGSYPEGSLMILGDSLYGTTTQGGLFSNGIVFKILKDGNGFTVLHDFTISDGQSIRSKLLYVSGYLYGTAQNGGNNFAGTVFKIEPSGNNFQKIFDFDFSSSGQQPNKELVTDGTQLFGTTYNGGAFSKGVLFKLNFDGSNFTKLVDFNTITTGSNPMSGVTIVGDTLFGTTYIGGASGQGVLYRILKDGSNFMKLHDFTWSGSDGYYPAATLYHENGLLYGTTVQGGSSSGGTIYQIETDGNGYSIIHNFTSGSGGNYPAGHVISDGEYLYGVTTNGGMTNSTGTIYKFQYCDIVTANTSATEICEGEFVTLQGGGATTYTWNNGVIDGASFAPSATTTYTVFGYGIDVCTVPDSITVIVNSNPVVTANSTNTVICEGDLITLNGSGATSYVWDNGATDGISFMPLSTATYTVTGTDLNNCTDTDIITITVNTAPVVTANATAITICEGEQITLTGSGANSYVWDNGVTDGISFTPTSSNTYSVTGTDVNNCTDSDLINITVNTLPNVTANSTALDICEGEQISLTGGGANSYSWDNGVVDNVPFSPTVSTTYTVTGTDLNLCENSVSIFINVNPMPDVSTTSTATSISAAQVGATYQWLNCGLGNTPIVGATNQTYSPSVNGLYSVIVTLNSCSDTSNCVAINSLELSEGISDDFVLYPNPAKSQINIDFKKNYDSEMKVELIDLAGNVLYTKTFLDSNGINKFNIRIEGFASGVYTVSIYTQEFTTSVLVVIEN